MIGAALAAHPAFRQLPAAALDALSARFEIREFSAGEGVVREGDPGDAYFILLEGEADVATLTSKGPVPLARLRAGDDFGEIALLARHPVRTATVTAVTRVVAGTLSAADFRGLVERDASLRTHFDAVVDTHLITRFIRMATPLAGLEPAEARALAASVSRRFVEAGATILRQGDPSDACFLLRSGAAEVLRDEAGDGAPRVIASLEAGTLIGEVGVVTGAPRNATVRATEPCELLVLDREAIRRARAASAGFAQAFMELARLRHRARRATGVSVHAHESPDGEAVTVLRHDAAGTYYRLSARGRFLWDRLDGEQTLKDLTLAYYAQFHEFAPDTIASILDGLDRAGFLAASDARRTWERFAARPGLARRVARAAVRLLEARVSLGTVDALVGRLYANGGKRLFGRRTTMALLATSAVGVVAWLVAFDRAVDAQGALGLVTVLVWLIPAEVIATILHELGHALAVKHAGRTLRGAGVGWYWFGPMAFVDTTDMWLASRRQRIIVGLAGPYANLLVATAFAIGALALDGAPSGIALELAALNYLAVLTNLNPLMDYDGYHVLTDWLDRPGLRRRALQWLAANLPRALWDAQRRRGHGVEMAYGLASVIYVAGMAALTIWMLTTLLR